METTKHTLELRNAVDGTTDIGIIENCQCDYSEEFQKDGYHKIVLVHTGGGTIQTGISERHFVAPCVLFYQAFQPFQLINLSAGTLAECIRYSNAFYCPDEKELSYGYNDILFHNPDNFNMVAYEKQKYEEVFAILQQIRNELASTRPDKDILRNFLAIFLMRAIKAMQNSAVPKVKTPLVLKRNFIGGVTQLVDNNFKTEKRTTFYANELCLAPNTLSKYMKKYFGITLTQLIHEKVATEAKRELRVSRKSIKEVAYDLGFDDSLYFSRLFKKITSVSPREYRV